MNQVVLLGELLERAQDLDLPLLVRRIIKYRMLLLKGTVRWIPQGSIDKIKHLMDNYNPKVHAQELPKDVPFLSDLPMGKTITDWEVWTEETATMRLKHLEYQATVKDPELEALRDTSKFCLVKKAPPKPPTKKAQRNKRKKNKRLKAKPTVVVESTWQDALAAAITQIGL